jgi:hypothetical protein
MGALWILRKANFEISKEVENAQWIWQRIQKRGRGMGIWFQGKFSSMALCGSGKRRPAKVWLFS